jgi:NAD(P)-dependent dehydrogenase (short-subunit alcohol dehydrogenase family)
MSQFSYTKLFDLTGKVSVVTGGAGILGSHFCKALVEAGSKVAIVDVNHDALRELEEEINSRWQNSCIAFTADVTQPSEVRHVVDCTVEHFGSIDVLHNNAASKGSNLDTYFDTFENYTLEQWREIMIANVDSMFLMAQAVGIQMKKQRRGGSIIQTASAYGIMAPDQRIYEGSWYMNRRINTPAVYSTSKAAVVGLSRFLATYWAQDNIRVNTLVPGGAESGQNEEFKRRYGARVPLGRMAQPFEIVGAVLYLASDASRYVTGHSLVVDGGLNAW